MSDAFVSLYKYLQNANIYYPENNAYFYLDFIEQNYYDELELVYNTNELMYYYVYMILVLDGKMHLCKKIFEKLSTFC